MPDDDQPDDRDTTGNASSDADEPAEEVDTDEPNNEPDAGEADADGSDDDSGGLSLKLPPIRLPSFFPENFRVLWPGGGDDPPRVASPRTVLLACVAFDIVDAVLALTVDAPLVAGVRTVGGSLVAAGVFGLLGLPYLWEPIAALLGYELLTAFPSLTALLLVRSLR